MKQALEFAEWLGRNGYHWQATERNWYGEHDHCDWSTEEIWQVFKKSTK